MSEAEGLLLEWADLAEGLHAAPDDPASDLARRTLAWRAQRAWAEHPSRAAGRLPGPAGGLGHAAADVVLDAQTRDANRKTFMDRVPAQLRGRAAVDPKGAA